MSKVFQGQNYRLYISVDADITGVQTAEIKYQKPDTTTGQWIATVESETTGRIYYDVTAANNDAAGVWKFWAYITFSNGDIMPGVAQEVTVYAEGE